MDFSVCVYWTEVLMGFAKLAVLFHRADCIANTLKKCIRRQPVKIINVPNSKG
jgi:hypothetical protein